jgi:hypothetical protein
VRIGSAPSPVRASEAMAERVNKARTIGIVIGIVVLILALMVKRLR